MADVTASVVSLGNPVSGISGYGKCLRVLRAYQGRIYYGAGNASNSNRNPNTNGGVLKYWNPATSAFVSTGVTPAEEQLDVMRIAINGDMIIPGIDSNADNVNAGWVRGVSGTFTKYNSVMANWSHCFDMVDFFDSVTSSLKMFAVGGVNGTASTVKVASGGVGTVSGDWADSTVLLNDPFRVFSAFVANGKVYFCHSVDQQINPNGAVIYEWVAGTTILATLKSAAVLKFADVFPSTSSATYTDRTNTSGVAIVSAKIVRPTHFGTRTFYIGGEAVNDQQIDPYALYSVSDGSAGTGIDVATFAKVTHPAVSGKTNLKPRDIWTDGSEIRVAYSYIDGSSNVCCSLISSTNGTTWTELFTLIPNGASGTAGGQTPVFAYEYLSGIHYFALGTDWFLTTDPAVQANVGELLAYNPSSGGGGMATLTLLEPGTGTSGTNINTRASTIGGTPTKIPALGTGNLASDGSGAIFGTANSFYYWPSAPFAGVDQCIIGEYDVITLLGSPGPSIGLREDDSVATGISKAYWLRYTGGQWNLQRFWTGAPGGTAAYVVATPVTYSFSGVTKFFLRFRVTGTSPVVIVADISTDGMATWTNIFNTTQSTNDPITGAGRPCVALDEAASASTGIHLNKLWAFDYPDTTLPVYANSNVSTSGVVCTVNLTEDMNPVIKPASGVTGFTVKANGVTQTISSAVVSPAGLAVTLNLSVPILSTDTVTVEYTPGNVTDNAVSPNALAAFTAQTVTNNSTQTGGDTTAPVFASAVLDTTGLLLDVTLTEAGSAPVLPATGVTGFAATVAAVSRSITSAVRLSSVVMRLTLSSAATAGQTVTVAYTPGNVTDSAGSPNAMTAFGAQAVTNNSTVPASGTITMDNALIIVNKDMWAVRNVTKMATNQQGAKFRYGVTVASNDNQTIALDVSGMSGVSASTTPTIMAWMDDVPLDLAGDGKNYLQLSNAGGSQTVTLKTAPANGFHVIEVQVRSFEQTSGAYLSVWGPGGGALPPVAVVLTGIGIGANSSLTALTPGTHYPTASILMVTHSRGLGVCAQLRQGDTSTATTAANNNISCSWPAFIGYGDGYEVSWRGHGGVDLDQAAGTPVSGVMHQPMMGATPLTGAEPTFMGTAWTGLLWSASDAPAYQGHYAILVMQGALNSPNAARIQAACTKIRSIWGGTPYIFWCSDVTRVNNAAMVAGVAAAAAALSDTKIQMLDTGISFMNIAGNVPNRNAIDGSHPLLPGQAAIAAAISYKLRQLTSAGGGSGSGGRKSMGMGI